MNYELAKELKDAGFPQDGDGGRFYNAYPSDGGREASVYFPTLSVLIEACGKDFGCLITLGGKYIAYPRFQITDDTEWYADYYVGCSHTASMEQSGSTPEEAVARLWLELNRKKV